MYSAQRHTMLRLLVVLCAHAVLVTSDECEYPRCAACPSDADLSWLGAGYDFCLPTLAPSAPPHVGPSPRPTGAPSAHPDPQPTPRPASGPIPSPTFKPTAAPTARPTFKPTPSPTRHLEPTPRPTGFPTLAPTAGPTTHFCSTAPTYALEGCAYWNGVCVTSEQFCRRDSTGISSRRGALSLSSASRFVASFFPAAPCRALSLLRSGRACLPGARYPSFQRTACGTMK